MLGEGFLAGFWAAIGSTLGKLSGSPEIVGESDLMWAGLLITMVLANTWGCRYFLRSLDEASNSVTPTVVSSASNYILSGCIGWIIFRERGSLLWWFGATLITTGLAMINGPGNKAQFEKIS